MRLGGKKMGILERLQAKPANDEGENVVLFPIRTFSSAEFNAFLFAGKAHDIDQRQVLRDFRTYLSQRSVPEYVAGTKKPDKN